MPGTIGFGMRAPVINNRRNAWYQKRNAVGIPRRAHTKKYLDAYYTGQAGGLQPPTGYAYALFNERGHSGTVRYGYVGDYTGVGETPYGAVSPNVVRDLFWARLAAQAPATPPQRCSAPPGDCP